MELDINAKKEIVKKLIELSGKHSTYTIFNDWIECLATSISNGTDLLRRGSSWTKREEQFKFIIQKYNQEEQEQFREITALLPLAYDAEMTDVLGEIYMESDSANKSTGQFFSPFSVSYLAASVALENYNGESKYTLNEPSAGSGGMIIATAKIMKEKGINYQKRLEVVAQDLDWKAVHMTYIQLSFLGIKATVIQGDTLVNEEPNPEQVFYTPAKKGMLI